MRDDALAAALAKTAQPSARVVSKAVDTLSDEEIIGVVCDGDTEAFSVLIKRHEDFVFTLARGIVFSDDAAKDIAQEVFLRAYRGIRRFEKRSSFKTWLYRIAYNTSMSHLKRLEKMAECDDNIIGETADYSSGQALRMTLKKLIEQLKPELKAVVIFHYFDDLKYEEIAEIMGCPVGTIKIRLFRAKHDLKELWERYAVQLP